MDSEFSRCDTLESMLQHGSSGPRSVSLEYLRNITNNFSEELGEGGFGKVYKGQLPNGETVAVKKLKSTMPPGVTDKEFEKEAYHLKRLKHPNIVLLVGWCSETENTYVEYNGKHICAEKPHRLLCLEYMPNGNLRQHLKDKFSELTWETRYKIIEGICYGLQYLHEESQLSPILHLDLKPANILLDDNMVPKIADFGLSRLFNEEKTKTCTISRDGTLGYMAPEHINRGIISTKSDIFGLGVIIIEIVTGHKDYPDETIGISSQEFTELVLKYWRNRLQKSLGYTSLEIYYQQIKRCIQIGLDCVKLDRSKRPTISQVIKMLKETESAVQNHPTHIDDNNQILSLGSHSFGVAPQRMPVEFLRRITNHFSEKQVLGSGTFGTVYKGVYNGEEFAVKMLHEIIGADKSQFENGFLNLLSINHPHIIKLVGYCYGRHNEHVEYDGKLRFSQCTYRVMCLEYMQGGSLDRYLTDCYNGSCDRDWRTLFNIIKGVCEGLYFLHEGCGTPILHLDLKPANILLDHNMVAKIADFGLSRLFQGASTHVTQRESVTGATKYMAPEYQYGKMMSPENDVFSLGVTMIEVIAGPTGYDEFCEMGDVKKFIDQVNTNWTKQIKATASPCASTECDQVDICIKIAMRCVDGERNNRPTIAEIVHILKETENRFLQLLMDQSLSSHIITKSGVVGGKAGTARDIEEKPWRLESLTITYLGLVDAFSYLYIDKAGKQQTIGPWGESYKGFDDVKTETILLEPSEFVEEVSGTYGSHPPDGILMTSLTFVTNIRTYGPFGNPYHRNVPSTPFSFRAAEDSSIVGFHGRSEKFIHSLGVYMTRCPSNMKIPRPLPMPRQILPTPTKHGPWGGSAGIARDIQQKPWHLESLTISYCGLIDAFSFTYTDQDGKKQSNGRWGLGYNGDKIETIRFETSEFLEEVSGTIGNPFGDDVLVMSITFFTNIRTYGPFGDPYFQDSTPTPFRIKADKDSRIVGFHGSSGKHLYSIGVYTI